VQRHRIEIVQFLAPAPHGSHEVRLFEDDQVLGHCLARHVEVLAELTQGLTVGGVQLIKQFPAARVGERLEHLVHCRTI